MPKAYCRNPGCEDAFDWDESTGDGEFCSWECADNAAELEQNTSDYDLAYGPRTVKRMQLDFEDRVRNL